MVGKVWSGSANRSGAGGVPSRDSMRRLENSFSRVMLP
jgi:hypothetical protein